MSHLPSGDGLARSSDRLPEPELSFACVRLSLPSGATETSIIGGLIQGLAALGRDRALAMFADWSDRIAAGEVPAAIVKQNDRLLAFQDINPQAPTHVLVIPRDHMESLDDASQKEEGLLGHWLRIGARVANEQGHESYRTVINTGAGAGQSVFHLHVHVLGGRDMHWSPG